jgi:hypothetical protein
MEESSTFIAVQCHGRGRDTTIEQIKMPEAFCSDLFVVVSNKFLEIVKLFAVSNKFWQIGQQSYWF